MKNILFSIFFVVSTFGQAMSTEDANKVVNQYEGFSQKVLGFINCISRVITGEEAIQPVDPKNLKKTEPTPTGLDACFSIAGFKTGGGFSKLTAFFSKGKKTEDLGNLPTLKNDPQSPDLDQVAQEVREELVKEAQRKPASKTNGGW